MAERMYGLTEVRHGRVRPSLLSRRTGLTGLAAVVAASCGVASMNWRVVLGVAAVFLTVNLASWIGPRRVFGASLLSLLTGFMFGDRGFAHIGVSPIYVGEFAFALGLVSFLAKGRARLSASFWARPTMVLLLGYVTWGAARTIPFVSVYGVPAVRDAVLWLYSLFTVFVVSAFSYEDALRRAIRWYRSTVPMYLLVVPAVLWLYPHIAAYVPSFPGSNDKLVDLKGGDVGVQLAGVLAFLALGLHQRVRSHWFSRFYSTPWALWFLWVLGLFAVAVKNRGGFVAVGFVLLMMAFRSGTARHLGPVAYLAIGFVVVALLIPFKVDVHQRRTFSLGQVAQNYSEAVAAVQDPTTHAGTIAWRLSWWSTIWRYTVEGPYRWTGKGYGVNLANADGYQVKANGSLRSPHSATFDVLARSGVPGLLLWIALQVSFLAGMMRGYVRARDRGFQTWARVDAWIVAYWVAFIINSSFDVFLEGPQGGIWFWSVIGFGLAALRVQETARTDLRAPAPSTGGKRSL